MIKNLNINKVINNIKVVKNYDEFRSVYGVFMEEPFYEAWTEDEFKEEYNYLKDNGEVIGYYNDEICGLLNLIDGAKSDQPVSFPDNDKVLYISDIAMKRKYRGRGYAKSLVNFLMNYLERQDYYENVYLRTNLTGSMSEGLFIPKGFEVMKNNGKIITQECSFKRTREDLPEIDIRKFLSKKIR